MGLQFDIAQSWTAQFCMIQKKYEVVDTSQVHSFKCRQHRKHHHQVTDCTP